MTDSSSCSASGALPADQASVFRGLVSPNRPPNALPVDYARDFRSSDHRPCPSTADLTFDVPAEGFPSEFFNGNGAQKTRMMPLPDGGKSLTICRPTFVSTQYQSVTDRQTDGQTDLPSRSACMGIGHVDAR